MTIPHIPSKEALNNTAQKAKSNFNSMLYAFILVIAIPSYIGTTMTSTEQAERVNESPVILHESKDVSKNSQNLDLNIEEAPTNPEPAKAEIEEASIAKQVENEEVVNSSESSNSSDSAKNATTDTELKKKLDDFIQSKAPGSPVTGEMLVEVKNENNLPDKMIYFAVAHGMYETKLLTHANSSAAKQCKSPMAMWVWGGKCNRPGGAYPSVKAAIYDYIDRMVVNGYIRNNDPMTFLNSATKVRKYVGSDGSTVAGYVNGVKSFYNQLNN